MIPVKHVEIRRGMERVKNDKRVKICLYMYIFIYIETVENTLEKHINTLKKNSNSKRVKNFYIMAHQSESESEAKSLLFQSVFFCSDSDLRLRL